jgi:hypothetical protein
MVVVSTKDLKPESLILLRRNYDNPVVVEQGQAAMAASTAVV